MKNKILYLIIGILLIALSFSIYHSIKQNRISIKDQIKFQDSLYYYKNKIDSIYVAKDLIEVDLNSINKYNKELKEEIKNLKEHPIIITKIETKFKEVDLEAITDSIKKDLNQKYIFYNWHINQNPYYQIEGSSYYSWMNDSIKTTINNIRINSGIWLDLIEDGSKFTVIARSDNPYIDVSNINSAIIDLNSSNLIKKKFDKKWSIGPYVGIGIGTYQEKIRPELQIGIGIQYSLWKF